MTEPTQPQFPQEPPQGQPQYGPPQPQPQYGPPQPQPQYGPPQPYGYGPPQPPKNNKTRNTVIVSAVAAVLVIVLAITVGLLLRSDNKTTVAPVPTAAPVVPAPTVAPAPTTAPAPTVAPTPTTAPTTPAVPEDPKGVKGWTPDLTVADIAGQDDQYQVGHACRMSFLGATGLPDAAGYTFSVSNVKINGNVTSYDFSYTAAGKSGTASCVAGRTPGSGNTFASVRFWSGSQLAGTPA